MYPRSFSSSLSFNPYSCANTCLLSVVGINLAPEGAHYGKLKRIWKKGVRALGAAIVFQGSEHFHHDRDISTT